MGQVAKPADFRDFMTNEACPALPLGHSWMPPAELPDPVARAMDDADRRTAVIRIAQPAELFTLSTVSAWRCDLRDNRLTWSDGVFDLFGLPRDIDLVRENTLGCYEEESREAMEALRGYAIRHRRGFTLDARLVQRGDHEKWMRLTTSVALEQGRPRWLYGTKQDITAERRRHGHGLPALNTRGGLAERLSQDANAPDMQILLADAPRLAAIGRRLGSAAMDACRDALLARLLRHVANPADIAQAEDHQFTALLRDRSDNDHATLRRTLAEPIYWRGYLLRPMPTVRIAPSFAESAEACGLR